MRPHIACDLGDANCCMWVECIARDSNIIRKVLL